MDVEPYLIFGDNLEECHKFCNMLIRNAKSTNFNFIGNEGSLTLPTYVFENIKSQKIALRVCGRYKDWSEEFRPSVGYEAPDIIMTKMEEDEHYEIFSTEFNDAISAGNNAWQRYPRVSQSIRKNIPFAYTVPVTDAEIYDGNVRSFRHPNIIFQVAQLILMAEERIPCLTFYSDNPWYEEALNDGKAARQIDFDEWDKYFAQFAFSLIDNSMGIINEDYQNVLKYSLRNMLYSINEFISDFKILEDENFHENVDQTSDIFIDYLLGNTAKTELFNELNFLNKFEKEKIIEKACFYNKTTSTSSLFKDNIQPVLKYKKSRNKKDFANFARFWGVNNIDENSMTKSEMISFLNKSENARKLPLSYCKNNMVGIIYNTDKFCNILKNTYDIDERIEEITELDSLLFLPIAGYVQDTGGPAFSRPDKGLVRLVDDIFKGRASNNSLVILYSELIPSDWKLKLRSAFNDKSLTQTNNLFRELSHFADYVISDIHQELEVL